MTKQRRAYLYQLPLTPYEEAWRLQKAVHRARVDEKTDDTLLLLEHPPTYTVGRRVHDALRLVDEDARGRHGIPIHRTERGGLVTYHGPGQLVGYPILKLKRYCRGPKSYLRLIEEVLIGVLHEFGLRAGRREGCPGVWMADRKIAAIGIHISRGVTMHGFALNIVNDLRPYDWIVPCGIDGCKITTMAKELGTAVGIPWVAQRLCGRFASLFGLQFQHARYEEAPWRQFTHVAQTRHHPSNDNDGTADVT